MASSDRLPAPGPGVIPRLLDRYVVGLWLRLFVLTALGFPIVSILINLTDSLNKLLDRGLTVRQIAVSYVYSVPENMFLVLPAAVLFATVFTIGSMARHSEITAAKAGGQSFRRLMAPARGALRACAAALGVVVGELAPGATARQLELQKARPEGPTSARFNFVYRADEGWVYTVKSLEIATRKLKQVLFERQGTGLEYPGLVVTADSATYDDKAGGVAALERREPGDRSARAAGDVRVPCAPAPDASPRRPPTCWPSRRRRTRCATRSWGGTSRRCSARETTRTS